MRPEEEQVADLGNVDAVAVPQSHRGRTHDAFVELRLVAAAQIREIIRIAIAGDARMPLADVRFIHQDFTHQPAERCDRGRQLETLARDGTIFRHQICISHVWTHFPPIVIA